MIACLSGKTFSNLLFLIINCFLAPQVICTLTKHLNFLALYIHNDKLLAIIWKFEKLKMVAQYAFKIKHLTAHDSLLGYAGWLVYFVFWGVALFCSSISYLLEVLILSLSLHFIYRKTAGNCYCHTSWK